MLVQMKTVRNKDELAKAVEEKEDTIVIEGDLAKKVIKIKSRPNPTAPPETAFLADRYCTEPICNRRYVALCGK